METEKKAMALVAAVGTHAEALRSALRLNTAKKYQNAIRTILEAYEGYVMAREEELVQREITNKRRPS